MACSKVHDKKETLIILIIIVPFFWILYTKRLNYENRPDITNHPESSIFYSSEKNHGPKFKNEEIIQVKNPKVGKFQEKLSSQYQANKIKQLQAFTSDSNKGKSHQCRNNFKLRNLTHITNQYDNVSIERHPNLPKFLTEKILVSSSIPDIPSIRWTGTVYQESWKESPKFLLYSAHFDTRYNSSLFIHILSYYDGLDETADLSFRKYFCQIWYNLTDNPVALPVYDSIRITKNKYGASRLQPFVSSCKVPFSRSGTNKFPIAVSLVKKQCQKSENVLRISSSPVKKTKPIKKNVTVGVCGKALYYYNNDFSTRLIEWVEILKVLGISKIFLYKIKCHKNVEKVLEFYEKQGTVKVINFAYPPPIVQEGTFIRLWSKILYGEYWSVQILYLNDCLLRNKDDFDYLGVFDSDEIPILKKHKSIPELLMFLRQENNETESYQIKWKTFYKDLKSQTQPLNETDRSYCFSHNIRTKLDKSNGGYEINVKSFYNTNQVVWVNAHISFPHDSNLAPKAKSKTLSRNLAYLGHFSQDLACSGEDFCSAEKTEEETALLPIRRKVVQEMNKVLSVLKI